MTPEDKLFMVYLLTNPHTTQLGVYEITPKKKKKKKKKDDSF